MPGLIELKRADVHGQSGYKREEKLAELDEIERLFEQIVSEGECVTVAELAVSGKDVIAAGVPRGPEIGRLLKRLLDMVIDDPSQNDRDILLAKIDEWK